MVVLFVCYSGGLGGAERLLVDFASGVGGEVVLACPEGELADRARAAGLRVFPIRSRSLSLRAERVRAAGRLAGHSREVRRLVGDLEPTLVVAWGMRSLLACLALRGTRVAFHHNDFIPGGPLGRLVRMAAARAELVTASSAAVLEDLGVTGVVVHPGVDLERFVCEPAPAATPEVVVVGALVRWKRPDLALEAVALARRSIPELRLRFVGAPLDGSAALEAELRRQAGSIGAVEFAGRVDDVNAELGRATCLLHCAEREPFGIAVLEALASGRPAIVPAAAGPAEIVDPSCGYLYPPGDAAAAAHAIAEVVSDPARAAALGAAGRERARSRFELGAARARYAAALRPLLGPGPSSEPAAALALVTVTHNSAEVLPELLQSVERHLPGARVMVVDCASSDPSVEIAGRYRCAAAIALPENVGFGRACNRGVAEVLEPVTALVNPDVELLDDSLLALAAEVLRRDRPDRLLAPLVLSPDGSRQDTVHPAPLSAADLTRAILPPALVPGRAGVALAPWRASAPRRVGWAVGCALVARTETLRRLGPFDPSIFLYGEDLELGLRAAAGGVQTWFWPSSRLLHKGGHTVASAFGGEPVELLARARHDAVARRRGARAATFDDVAQAVTFGSRLALKRALGRPAERERRQLDAVRGVWRRQAGG